MFASKHNPYRKGAFTLIEIMVATTVMIIMVGLVIQITSQVLNVWNRSAGKLSANAEARIAMEILTSDLETAVFRNNGLRWLEAVQSDVPDPLDGIDFKTTSLQLFSPAQDRPTEDANGNPIPGGICAINYELVYQDPIDGDDNPNNTDSTFALHRRLIDPKTTFESLLGRTNQETFTAWDNDSTVTLAGGIVRTAGDYQPTDRPEYFLASNVVDFQLVFFYIDNAGRSRPLNGRNAAVPDNPVLYGGTDPTVGPGSTDPATSNSRLNYAEIRLTILSDEAMELLRQGQIAQAGFENNNEGRRRYVAANSEVFTRRVYFPAQPL